MKLYTHIHYILADMITPIGLYTSLRDHYQSPLLLESSDYNSKNGHFSYICLQPLATISLKHQNLRTQINQEITNKAVQMKPETIVNALIAFKNQFKVENQEFPFCYSGLFGYTGYDIINYAEDLSLKAVKTLDIPEFSYSLYGIILVFDHSTHQLYIISHHLSEKESLMHLQKVSELIETSLPATFNFEAGHETTSSLTDEDYKKMVSKAREHCQQGDVFQLVLSRRFSQKFTGDEFNVYRALKNINPSPYLFYFDLGDFKLFGSSPEAQLVIKHETAEIHPIAGTYKRTGNDLSDFEKARELMADKKENAEHMMLVDLARNDLSKYCTDVKVDFLKQVQFYSHVIHLVSKVTGKIKKLVDPFTLLLGTFPAGTLSGSPKYKAMQLIDGYEPEAREFYGGCAGFISHDNQLNHAIMIRTFLSKDNVLHYQAGAGIVVSSDDEKELQEINHKVSALRKAIAQANKTKIHSSQNTYSNHPLTIN